MLPSASRLEPAPRLSDAAPPSAALWLGAASLIVGVGVAFYSSGWSMAWMRQIHQHQWFHPAYWSFWTTMGFGWACAIAVSVSDRRGDSGLIAALLVSLLLSAVISPTFKTLLALPRPVLVMPHELLTIGRPVAGLTSMPSGHAMAGFTMAGLWVLALRGRAWASPSLMAACWAVAALIAASRVAVGAHWPADVLVGSGMGVSLAWASWHIQQRWMTGARWAHPGWAIAVECIAALVAFTANEGYPLATWVQWVMGALALASAAERVWRWRQGTTAARLGAA